MHVDLETAGGDVLIAVLAEEAIEALVRIATTSTPAVLEGLKNPLPNVRLTCVELLDKLARQRRGELPIEELLGLLDDGDRRVR